MIKITIKITIIIYLKKYILMKWEGRCSLLSLIKGNEYISLCINGKKITHPYFSDVRSDSSDVRNDSSDSGDVSDDDK